MNIPHRIALAALCASLLSLPGAAQNRPPAREEIPLREGLLIRPVGQYGRNPLHLDAIERQIVDGRWAAPAAGDTVLLPDGSMRTWEWATANQDGWFEGPALRGGYVYLSTNADRPRVMILEAAGHNMVYVNGEPRAGDPYSYGYVRLPVSLRAGRNDLLFHVGRGRLKASLVAPSSPAMLNTADTTLPDLLPGEKEEMWGAVVVLNATEEPLRRLFLRATPAGAPPVTTPLPDLLPLSVRKVGFRLGRGWGSAASRRVSSASGRVEVRLELLRREGRRLRTLDAASIGLRLRRPGETYKRTFLSAIDGSVQYYAVNPASPAAKTSEGLALFLSLHGAGVEAIGQADAYSSKSWGHLVAPTNRRPYGFDWEDWGRLDALEVLEQAQKCLKTDPQRTYLTGHSMGGHGTWQVGATFPDRFAAIAPSAGWISFWSYAGAARAEQPDSMQAMLARASTPSDTLALARNYAQQGVYVLHGDADDNVPVSEARTMRQHLAAFHRDLTYFEQPGAGHWWDASDEPGTDCVDWAPLFDLFARRRIPTDESVRQVDFTTASPAVSARCHWVCVEAQIHPLQISSVQVRCDPGRRRFVGTTENVARLAFRLRHLPPGLPLRVELDGQNLENIPWPAADRLWLTREQGTWKVTGEPAPSLKGPHRYGPFKEAFRHRMVFVYGTQGTPEENAWAFARARYDAETFWYRGNGSVEVVADTAFDPAKERDRNVILYGRADTNAAWSALLADSPVQVSRGRVRIGDHEETGENLACLFVRPRPGSALASVGVVTGSGIVGMRLTDRMPYFVSGVAYPDCIMLTPDALTKGAEGVRAAGFFGLDWGVSSGEFVWGR